MIGLGDGLNVGVKEESGIRLVSGNVKSAIRPISSKIKREIWARNKSVGLSEFTWGTWELEGKGRP